MYARVPRLTVHLFVSTFWRYLIAISAVLVHFVTTVSAARKDLGWIIIYSYP